MSNYSKFSKKELGSILTPRKTASYIVSRLGKIEPDQTILDPCVGPGVFIKILLKSGVNVNQIYSYDINPDYKKEIEKLGVNFEVKDTLLNINSDSFSKFNFIIENPPYLNKASSYIRKNKSQLKKIYGHINAHETYSMFIVNSIWRLKEGGKLGIITSDSFLTLSTHKKLRKFILENCCINEISLPPKDLFSKQGVSINSAIIILTKYTSNQNEEKRKDNLITIITRLDSEEEYFKPRKIFKLRQEKYYSLPFNIFFIDVEPQIIELFERSPKLKDFIQGYIGMHTHNNKKFIAAIEGTDLAQVFKKKNKKISDPNKKYKIISQVELDSGNWKPYQKRGGNDQYFRPLMEALLWDDKSISVYDIPNNVPFEQEGIVISGISSRLAARYMPKGCYWDSNKAIGFTLKDKGLTIHYVLGLLNSSLYNYLAKGIINNTNSIQITGIHSLPFIPPEKELKERIEKLVKVILENKMKDGNYNYINKQKLIDNLIFEFYAQKFNFPKNLKQKLDKKYAIY